MHVSHVFVIRGIFGGGQLWGPQPPWVTKGMPKKRRKRKGKEEREKEKEENKGKEKRGDKKRKDRKVNQYHNYIFNRFNKSKFLIPID